MTQSTKPRCIIFCLIIFQVKIAFSKQYQPIGDSNYLELESPHINVKYINIDLDKLSNDMRSNDPDGTNEKSEGTNNINNKPSYTNQKIITRLELGHENFQPKLLDYVKMRSKDSESENEKSIDTNYKCNKSYYKMQNDFKTEKLDKTNFKSNSSDYEDMKTDDKTQKLENKNHKRIKTRELHNENLNLDYIDNENTTLNVSEQNKSYENKISEDASYMDYIYERTKNRNKTNVRNSELDHTKYLRSNHSDDDDMRSNDSKSKQEKLKRKHNIYTKQKKTKPKKIKRTEQDYENMLLNNDNTRSKNYFSSNNTSEDKNYKPKTNKSKYKSIKTKERVQENIKVKRLDHDNTSLSKSNSENEASEKTDYNSYTTDEPDNMNLKTNSEDMSLDDITERSEISNYSFIHFRTNLLDQVVVTGNQENVTNKPDFETSQRWLGGESKFQEAIARLNFIRKYLNDTTPVIEQMPEEYKPTILVNDVFFAVRTTQLYHKTRLPIILKTWFPMAKDMTYFFTDYNTDLEEHSLIENHMVTTNCNKTYSQESLCCKMESAFTFFFDFYKDVDEKQQPSWFCHFDDDTYVNINTLLEKLSQFDAQKHWYIGRQYTENFDPKGKYLVFAERGGGICLSRTLLMELQPHLRNRKFLETCESNDIRDDEALGYIIREKANGTLTNVPEFQGDIGNLARIPTELLRQQITVGYRLDRKVVKVLGFSLEQDPTRLISLHCYLYPDARYCYEYKESLKPRKYIEPIREFKFVDVEPKEKANTKPRRRRVRPTESNFWQKIRSFFLNILPKIHRDDDD